MAAARSILEDSTATPLKAIEQVEDFDYAYDWSLNGG